MALLGVDRGQYSELRAGSTWLLIPQDISTVEGKPGLIQRNARVVVELGVRLLEPYELHSLSK